MDDHALRIRDFVLRIMSGEPMNTPESLQFYLNHKEEIEEKLRIYWDDSSLFTEGSE